MQGILGHNLQVSLRKLFDDVSSGFEQGF